MAQKSKNNNKMNMNMPRPSMLWIYGLIGAFIIGICETLIKGTSMTVFSDAFTFALLIVVLVVKPTGLFGEKATDKV